jgi:hypothetical protein
VACGVFVVFRLFRSIDFLLLAKKALRDRNPVTRILSFVDNIAKALRMALDNLHWAVKIGLLRGNEPLLNKSMMIFWFAGLVLGIIQSTYVLYGLMLKEELLRSRKDVSPCGACFRVMTAKSLNRSHLQAHV